MTNPKIEDLGWSEGRDRWGDGTGAWHLIVSIGGITNPACGTHGMTYGMVESRSPAGKECGNCKKVANKKG